MSCVMSHDQSDDFAQLMVNGPACERHKSYNRRSPERIRIENWKCFGSSVIGIGPYLLLKVSKIMNPILNDIFSGLRNRIWSTVTVKYMQKEEIRL
jgi:hypothetical protein